MKKEISTLDELIEAASYITNADEIDTIKKAYEFAYNVHKGEKRLSGDDYILHPQQSWNSDTYRDKYEDGRSDGYYKYIAWLKVPKNQAKNVKWG